MSSTVFVVGKNNELSALRRTPYNSEDLFQTLLADHPEILSEACGGGDRLLLIKREASVPDAGDASGRWSLDHLFIDRLGVPVLVEVKRANDTRARREVVAQMLDYAANGVAYWPIEQIVADHAATCDARGEAADASLTEFLGPSDSIEEFWRQVEANLRSGRVRMVFVADVIHKELRRIVEFLNEQMRPAEVLAVSVEQHATPDGLRLLTPTLIGNTERAVTQKAVTTSSSTVPGGVDDWIGYVEEQYGPQVAQQIRSARDWFSSSGFSTARTKAGISVGVVTRSGRTAYPFFIQHNMIWADLYHLQSHEPFGPEGQRQWVLNALRALPGKTVTSNNAQGYPSLMWRDLTSTDVWGQFEKIALTVKAALESGRGPS